MYASFLPLCCSTAPSFSLVLPRCVKHRNEMTPLLDKSTELNVLVYLHRQLACLTFLLRGSVLASCS